MNKTPKLRFKEFSGDWEEKKLDEFLTESKIKGSTGEDSKKLTVKLWGKGVVPKKEVLQGSSETQYYIRKAGQLMYGKLDFLNCAFGIVPDYLDGYESTLDAPALDVKNANINFLLRKITQKNFYKKYGDIADGSRKAKRVHVGTFLDMSIRIPSLEEQEKIASFFSLIDDKISLQGEKVEALKDYKKGMMQKIFSRELRFTNSEGRNYSKWKDMKLGDCVDIFLGLTYTPTYTDTGVPFLSVKDISNGKINFDNIKYISYEEYENSTNNAKPKKDDILFGRVGTLGSPIVIKESLDMCIFVSLGYLRTKTSDISNKFIAHWMNSDNFFKQVDKKVSGSSQKNLNTGWLKEFYISIPTKQEQIEISRFLDKLNDKLDKEQDKLDCLNEYKKGLLQQMFI